MIIDTILYQSYSFTEPIPCRHSCSVADHVHLIYPVPNLCCFCTLVSWCNFIVATSRNLSLQPDYTQCVRCRSMEWEESSSASSHDCQDADDANRPDENGPSLESSDQTPHLTVSTRFAADHAQASLSKLLPRRLVRARSCSTCSYLQQLVCVVHTQLARLICFLSNQMQLLFVDLNVLISPLLEKYSCINIKLQSKMVNLKIIALLYGTHSML